MKHRSVFIPLVVLFLFVSTVSVMGAPAGTRQVSFISGEQADITKIFLPLMLKSLPIIPTPTSTHTPTLTPTHTPTPTTTQAAKTPTPTHTRTPTSFPLTGILDDFNRGNEGPPPSTNWDIVQHGHAVLSQQCIGVDDADDNLSAWKTAYNTPIEAYLTIRSGPNESVFSFYMLHNYDAVANEDGYECWFDTRTGYDKLHICRVDNQVEAQLGDLIDISDIAINDSIGMSVQDGVIRAWWKPSGGSWTLLGERSDSTYDGPFYIIPETWALGIFDNLGGGTVGASTSISPSVSPSVNPKNIWMWAENHPKISIPILSAIFLLFFLHTSEVVPVIEKIVAAISKLT
jgi:hypothetical protein